MPVILKSKRKSLNVTEIQAMDSWGRDLTIKSYQEFYKILTRVRTDKIRTQKNLKRFYKLQILVLLKVVLEIINRGTGIT